MKPKIFIDLELERPNTEAQAPDSKLDCEKIIQVGWCVIDSDSGFVLTYRCYHINIGVPLSNFIKELTGITDDNIMNGMCLKDVYEILNQDRVQFDTERKLYTWGGGDQPCIQEELGYPNDWAFGRSAVNVKHLYQIYAATQGLNSSGGLKRSMQKLDLKWDTSVGKTHNACADALNTWVMFNHITKQFKDKK